MIPLSEGEIGSILVNCIEMPGGYLIHAKVRELCETALYYMRLAEIPEHSESGEKPGVCRVCGCTQDRSCDGGCFRVEADLCSRCVGELEKM